MTPDPYASQRRGRNLVLTAVGLAALVGGLVGIGAFALLSRRDSAPAAALSQRTAGPPPLLAARGTPPPPALGETRKRMPDELRAYLEHVERIERKRADLSKKGLGALLAALPAAQQGLGLQGLKDFVAGAQDPENAPEPRTGVDELKGRATEMRAKWGSLTNEFAAVPPPDEARGLADEYGRTLRETGAQITDILDAVATSGDDPQKAVSALTSMKGGSTTIDASATRSDREVGRLCDKYDTRKWFAISADFGLGGDLLGGFGAGTGGGAGGL